MRPILTLAVVLLLFPPLVHAAIPPVRVTEGCDWAEEPYVGAAASCTGGVVVCETTTGAGAGGGPTGAGATTDCVRACNDGVDNDADGRTDHGAGATADPGCASRGDDSERGSHVCDDGLDNDADRTTDHRPYGGGDPGCASPTDASERGTTACDNGLDDDGDGSVDYGSSGSWDRGCYSPADTSELGSFQCDNGLDDDGDGRLDYKRNGSGDPGCYDATDRSERGTAVCDDGLDNDGDDTLDYHVAGAGDPGCGSLADASERGSVACDDGLDNDGDGAIDAGAANDPGCAGPADTSERGSVACDDGADNDADGRTDFRVDGTGDLGCASPSDTFEGVRAGAIVVNELVETDTGAEYVELFANERVPLDGLAIVSVGASARETARLVLNGSLETRTFLGVFKYPGGPCSAPNQRMEANLYVNNEGAIGIFDLTERRFVDSVSYGTWITQAVLADGGVYNMVEREPAPGLRYHPAIVRWPDGYDTNNNASDFYTTYDWTPCSPNVA